MSKFEISKERGQHKRLASLVGDWEGNTRTWFEKEVLADEAPMQAKIYKVFDGRFLNYEYEGVLNAKPYQGKMIWAYDLGNEKCQCSWIDTFHMGTGILQSEGTATKKGFEVIGKYGWLGIPQSWGWRTEIEIVNPDHFIIRAFNISPEGEEAKATETTYHRVL